MKFLILLAIVAAVMCEDMAVTKAYVEYLKNTVSWEVEEYESNIFRGWTVDDVKSILALNAEESHDIYPEIESVPTPSSVNWAGAECDHGPKNQGKCGSCWAFANTGMLSDRCCMNIGDNGWLAPQELVSCDSTNAGCQGGGLTSPVAYMLAHKGLVREECFPYQAADIPCAKKCADGSDFKAAHVCDCKDPRTCSGINGMKACLTSGPVTLGFFVCRSFLTYKSGIYHCDCTEYLGGHAVLAMGYGAEPECHYTVKNSWGTVWGDKGYFDIACETCRIYGGAICGRVA